MVSGTWTSLPSEWANVTAEVPTLNGYTAYTGGPASNTNKVPANQFVFPSWNGSDGSTSETDKGSTAYTDAATLYEAKPVHTILYVPEQTEARTVTTKFVYAGGDKDGQKVASDTQIQVYFKRTGTINTATNKVTYGSWTWDKSAGDTDHPGFHIISGNWTISSDGQFSVKAPTVAGYTAAMLNSSGSYGTTNFATPTFNSDTVFTNNTASQWYVRNELTTYYVPNSSVNKTVVRTITITPPNTIAAPTSVTQTATINRLVRVNSDDTGVVYDGFNGSGWSTNTGSWTAYRRIMSYAGYTTVITQVVTNPDGTTTETKLKSIDAQTVDGNTLPTTINVTYTATSTAVLSGEASSTYNGQPISYNDINGGSSDILVQVSGPMAGYYTVGAGDLEFSSDGGKTWSTTLPTNAGTYQLRLTTQGEDAIKAQYGNNSIKWVNEDGTSTIGGSATYIINKTDATATIGGSYERDYDGQPINGTSIYNKITWAGRDTSNNKDFTLNHSITANDYAWYTKSGDQYIKVEGQPVNAGVYYLILNNYYITTLDEANPNYSISKVDGAFVYTINKAQAGSVTFDASVQKTYDGSAILNGASFNTAPSIVIKGADGKPLAGLNNYTFQSGDFEFVDSTGNTISAIIDSNGQIEGPINAGTYTIRLTQAGLNRIEQANPNVNFANVQLADTGSGTLTISQYVPTLNLSGEGSKTYDGQVVTSAELIKQDKDNTITIKLTVPKQGGGTTEVTYAFNPNMDYTGDYDWYSNGTKINAPKNAGTYVIQLKADQVKTILEDLISQDSNYSYLKGNLDLDKLQVAGQASYTINKKPLTVYLDGNSSAVYTGSGAEMPLQDLISHLKANGLVSGETLNTDTFDKADFQWYVKNADGTYSVFTGKDAQGNTVQTPINVGTYYIGILPETSTNSGIDTLRRDNTNYDVTIDYSKYYQFDITPAKGTLTLSGSQTDTYNGQAHNITGYTLTIGGVGLPSGQTVTLKDGDLEYYVDGQWTTNVPKNAGTYQVRLNNSKLTELESSYTNFSWTSDNVTNNAKDYVINPTQVQVSFTGKPKQVIYNGQVFQLIIVDAMKGYFNMTGLVNGDQLTYPTLSSDQFEWVDSTGNVMPTVPVDVGTYTLRFKTTSDMDKLNSNYKFVFAKDSSGNDINGWQWIIDKATATITFTTGNQKTAWTGQPTVLDPNNFAVTISTNNGQTLTASDLTVNDFQFYDQNGQAIATPTAVGSYTIKLKQSGLDKIEKDTANYTWINNANGSYEITKAQVSITLNGESSMTYDGRAASFPVNSDGSVNGITVTLSNGKNYILKPGDLAFINDKGEYIDAPVNAGEYKVTLSQVGLNNINKIDGENYQYTLDKTANTANFTIEKADATIALNGTGTHVYNGQAASTNEGSYTIQLPGQTTSTIVNADNLAFVNGAPTDAGTYSIALSDDYKKQLQDIYGNNYNLKFTDGSFTVTPKTVNLILNGYSSQVYDGQPAKVSDISNLTLTWGDHTTTTAPGDIKFTLSADDLEVVDKNGQTPTAANAADQDSNPYYIQLKSSILNQLNGQNKNYNFVIGDTYARYTIYAKETNVTFTGKQFANYGSNPMPAIYPSNYTLTWTDAEGNSHNIELTANDLTVEVPSGVPTDQNGLPLNAGQYVVKVKQSVIDDFNTQHPDYKLSNDPNTNAWYVVKHREVSFTIDGTPSSTYNGQAVSIKDGNYSISFGPVSGNQNSGVLSGDQTAFNAIKWDASDFEFVNGAPTNAGTYQVRLSSAGLQKLQDFANGATGSNYDFSSVVTVDNGKFTASSVTGNYTVNKNELTVSLTNKDGQTPSSVIGKYDLSAGNYTLTITPTETIYGADGKPITLTYDLKDSDLAYKNGTPSNIGTYDVQLTAAAVNDLEQKFGTANYTYKLSPSATHEITKGTGTITLSGGQTETYTGQPAVLNHHKYFVTVATNIYSDSSYLNAGDMQYLVFFTKNADGSYTQLADKPTDVGTYYVGLNDYMVKLLQDATGNNGENYNWSQNYATYVITAAKGTATGSFSNSSSYNAQPIGKQDITVNVTYPGAKSNTYTLQDGDYEYVNKAGSVVTDPTDAGTYTIRLTTAGENHIKQLGNVLDSQGNITKQNVDWTINFTGSYTINAVQMTVTVNGTQNETYDGNAKTINIGRANGVNVTISADGLTVPTIPTTGANALTADDFTIKDAQGNVVTNPTNAGTYKIYLNSKGLAKLGNLSANFIVPESLEQSADLIIARQDVNITEGSTGKTFDAQSAALTDEQFAQYKKAITDAGYNVDGLTVDGIDWWFDDTVDYGTQGNPTNPIKDIGTYNLRLNAKGQKELDDANPNYKLKVGDFKYTIYPEVVHIEVDGTQNADWDNQGVSIDPTKFVPKFVVYGGENGDQLITNPVRDDGQPLTLPAGVQLVPGDYEFVDDDGNVIKSFTRQDGTTSANPFKVGSYKVRLTEEGWKKLATQSTDNVKYQYDNSTGTLNINQITPDITLDGANWKTYDGQPVSFDELVSKDPTTNQQLIYVSVTSNGHTIYLPLDPGTYNWSSNGQLLNTAPSQVGTYTITLNKDRVIESLNNWMANNSDYKGSMKILADNIKGSALFEIRARNIADLVADPASGSQTYNGQTAQIDLSAVVGSLKATDSAGKVWKLNTSTLTLDDYTITDPNGNVLTGFPVNVGTYTFKINEKGIAALASANPNFTIPNEINGYSYTYTINQANASGKLDGTNFGTYTGKAITTAQVNSNGRIVVTVDYPGIAISDKTYTLQDGDYTWNTENGSAPTDVGKYTITLTKAGIANVENYILKLAGTGQEGKSNVVFADNAITGSATYTINKAAATISISDSQKQTMPWTGNPAKIDPSNFVPTITSDGQTIAFPSDLNLTSDDYEFVNDKGEVITAPSEIGTYMVRLTGNGWQKVRDAVAGNSNYTWTYEGQGSFEITKAEATVVLSGSSSTVYTGQGAVIPSTDGVVNGITVTVDGKSYNLTPDDLEFVDDQGNVINPVDAGSYKVRLKNDKISSITGLDLTHYNYNYSGNTVQFDITQMPLTITVSDKDNVPTVIYGESTTLNPSDYNIKVTDANGNIMDYTPVAGDLQFKDGVPTSSGTYEVILSDQGLKNIQDKFGTKNYTYTSAGQGSFIVNKATANVKTSGSYEATYDGKTPEIDVAKVINTITTNNGASLTVNNLTADDFEWVDADGNAITSPVNVGTYYLKLKDSSHSKIATNDNYDWSFSGLASVTINKANATIKFSGNDTVTYTGNKVAPTPDAFTVTLADGQTYKLTANDIQVIGDPVNVGTYQVELTQAGIDAINKANPNYNYSYDGSKGTLTIDPAQATATISGLQTSKQPQVDPKNYTVTVNGQTITGLTADDFIFSKDGHPVKLIEAGTYDVELSGDAIDKIRQANPNYNITFSSTAKFTLENSSQTINYVDGSGNVISSTEIGDQLEGTKVSFTPDVPAGWALTDPNNVPSEITISNGTTTIEIKHGTIVVTPDTPEDQIPKGQVPGDPDKQYEELGVLDLKPTRKIIITLPDGTVQEILQQGNLTRTATFDEVTGKITYSDWTAKDGKGAWDEYEPTQIPGYTIHITETVDGKTKDIDSISKVTVSADTQDTTINITYTRDQQPTQPTQPSDSTNPSVPTNPSEPTNPAQPTSPTQPGKPDKPEKPNKNKDDANKQNNKPAKPNKKKKNSKQDKRGQSNNMPKHADMNSRSPKHAATAIANKKGGVNSSKSITAANAKNELPQTGDKQEGIAAWLGLLLSSLGIFNLIGDKKRKKK